MKIYRPKEVSDSSWACNLRYLSIDQHMLGKAVTQFLELLLHYFLVNSWCFATSRRIRTMNNNRKINKQDKIWNETKLKDCMKKQYIITFVAAVFWGLAAHGYIFLNKFCWHDDMKELFGVGATYSSGRWFLGILGETVQRLFGNVSVPWFHGLVSLLFLAAGSVLLAELFQLKQNVSRILLAGMMVVFPSWTVTYAYMFTAAYYASAVFLAILGIYLVWKASKAWCGMLSGAVCFCLSLGIYQAYLPLAATILLIAFLNDVIVKEECSFREHFMKGILGVCTLAFGVILYFIVNQFFLYIMHVELTDYQNIKNMGQTNIKMIAEGIVSAWKDFLVPSQGSADMYMQSARGVYYAVLGLSICFLVYHIIQCWKKNRTAVFFLLAGALCFPVGVNLLYLMGDMGDIYGIMLYAKAMVFILPIVLVERIKLDTWRIRKYGTLLLSILLIYVGVFYTHYANACYLQAEFHQEQVISWLNTLVARIQSEDGYNRGLPIVYLNSEGPGYVPPESTLALMEIPNVDILPYQNVTFSNWKTALFRWCGFRHEELTETSEIESWQEVLDMPSYPDSGSVRIIKGIIIVKF